jgi:hypothetical protein
MRWWCGTSDCYSDGRNTTNEEEQQRDERKGKRIHSFFFFSSSLLFQEFEWNAIKREWLIFFLSLFWQIGFWWLSSSDLFFLIHYKKQINNEFVLARHSWLCFVLWMWCCEVHTYSLQVIEWGHLYNSILL